MKQGKSYTVLEIREKLAHYCAYQDRSHWEVERKLNEFSLIPEARDEILIYLLQNNFLNEERFARSFARGKFYQKSWGRIKIKQELKKRDIPEILIKIAFQEIDEEDYIKTIDNLIEKKKNLLKESNEFKKNQKIIRYLMQKGFEYQIIKEQVLNT